MNSLAWRVGPIVVIGIVGAILLALPVRIPYSVTVPGKVLCAQEIVITLSTDGGIVSSVINRTTGLTQHYAAAQFTRGDAMQFAPHRKIAVGSTVHRGDTIGVVQSSENDRELERLRGELDGAVATLATTVTGEKQSIVDEARQQVEYARTRAEELKSVLARSKLLYEKGLTAQQEYELADRRASIAHIDVSIAESRLTSVSTGAKKEQAELVRSQIKSLQREIAVLESRKRSYSLLSPLSGVVMQVGAADTLLVVSDTTDYVVVMPVPLRERQSVGSARHVSLSASEVDAIPPAIMIGVDKTIHMLNGQQVVLATAQLEKSGGELLHGLLARCSIECPSLAASEYVNRKVHSLVR
ncbi:MAG: hypothetical protein HY961_00495 [Ignavibacteriae bacterium]|nr:hypothetical protein [Ignavibacteriota bacterium]